MSISNFSFSHDPNAAFLTELEDKVAKFIKERMVAFAGMTQAELQKAQVALLFEVEEFRMRCIQDHCRDRDAQSVLSPSISFMPNLLPSKWYKRTVFTAKDHRGRPLHAVNSDIANRKKSSVMLERATMLSILKKNRRSSNILNGEKTVVQEFEETRVKLINLSITKDNNSSLMKNLPESALKRLAEANEDNEDADNCSYDSLSEVNRPEIIHGYDIDELISNTDTISIESADSDFDGEVTDDSASRLDCLVLSLLKTSTQELEFNSEALINICGVSSSSNINSETNVKKLAEKGMMSLKYKLDDVSGKIPAMIFYTGSLLSQPVLSKAKKSFLLTSKNKALCENLSRKLTLQLSFQNNSPQKQGDRSLESAVSIVSPNNQTCKFSFRMTKKHIILEQSTKEPKLAESLLKPLKNSIDEIYLHFDPAEKTHCKLEIKTASFSPFINLSLTRFQGNLLVEPGMHFQINQRVGFMVTDIIKSIDVARKAQILKAFQSKVSLTAHCANHDLSMLPEFFFNLTRGQEINSQISAEELYKQFCLNQLLTNDSSDFLVISMIEFMPQYNIYRMCETCIVFEYKAQGNEYDKYFYSNAQSFSHFTIGHSLVNVVKKFEDQYINAIFNFFAPYDIHFGFDTVTQSYFLTYLKPRELKAQVLIASFHHKDSLSVDFIGAISPLASNNVHKDEGIWVSLNKLTANLEVQSQATPVKVPFESMLMFRDEIYFLDRRHLGLAYK